MTLKGDRAIHIVISGACRLVGLFGLAVLPVMAVADDQSFSASTTLGFGRAGQLMDEDGTMRVSFENAPHLYSTALVENKLPDGAKLTYGADLEVTGNKTAHGVSGRQAGLSVTYQQKFGEDNAWQYRVIGNVDRSHSEGSWDYHRERVGVQLQYRHSPKVMSTAMVRFGYREQNEDRLAGFDQFEYLAQLTHMVRPNKDRFAISGTVYAEARRADLERFSYDEFGLRLMIRVPLSEQTEVTARSTVYNRAYLDAFSSSDPTTREDDRVKAVLEVDHTLNEKYSLAAFVGWDENVSTIAERAHGDATVGFSVTYNWR
ncbi:hypothetical protein SAMN04488515_2278 [Cognatiyoonia koreensis]|uniref:Salt-induced outer membrane protein n=1 Tax=Cognatiyoonia koreensis TaxID=364200 RepID=A0A1I0QY94_9RHOB|nr:hypothetical protein [Cognatiyoonia koreensis]SEW32035.1 hypothetical protein SAMN04488515_2278 [Cognatiyoonia koreensis]